MDVGHPALFSVEPSKAVHTPIPFYACLLCAQKPMGIASRDTRPQLTCRQKECCFKGRTNTLYQHIPQARMASPSLVANPFPQPNPILVFPRTHPLEISLLSINPQRAPRNMSLRSERPYQEERIHYNTSGTLQAY